MTPQKWETDAIDAHVHIWTDDLSRYPLDSNFTREDLAISRFMPDDILAHAGANGVGRVLLIQMSYYGFDNTLMLEAIRHDPSRFAGIAVIDENDSELALTMQQLRTAGVRGFRVVLLHPKVALAERPGLQRLLAEAAGAQTVIDFLTGPQLLSQIDQICANFPDTSIVVDHMARIGMNGPIDPQEVDALCRLARHPNTAIKTSAFYALGQKAAPYDDLAPLIRRLYDAFGPARLMWGSDAPFQTMSGTYRESVDLIRDRLPFLTGEDKNWILRDTAQRLFFS